MKQYSFADLELFCAIVEAGSFQATADRLALSTPSVSRKLAHLESCLGVRLLNRSTRKLSLTEAGQQFLIDAQHILNAADEAENKLQSNATKLQGVLKIAAPLSFGIEVLSKHLPEFIKQHPKLEIKIQLEDHITDLYADGIDVALRIGGLENSNLIAQKICDYRKIACASPEYLTEHGRMHCETDLKHHKLLHYDLISLKDEWKTEPNLNLDVVFSCNNGEMLLAMAKQGLGITLLPEFICAKALETGELVSLDLYPQLEHLTLYALRPSRKFTPLKVKALIEFLIEKLTN